MERASHENLVSWHCCFFCLLCYPIPFLGAIYLQQGLTLVIVRIIGCFISHTEIGEDFVAQTDIVIFFPPSPPWGQHNMRLHLQISFQAIICLLLIGSQWNLASLFIISTMCCVQNSWLLVKGQGHSYFFQNPFRLMCCIWLDFDESLHGCSPYRDCVRFQ